MSLGASESGVDGALIRVWATFLVILSMGYYYNNKQPFQILNNHTLFIYSRLRIIIYSI